MFTTKGFFLFILLFVLNSGGVLTKSTETVQNKVKSNTIIDIYLSNVLDQSWSETEEICLTQTLNILRSAQNSTLWATWVMDSMQLPTGLFYGSRYNFGNFDECIKPHWLKSHPELLTQYCIADVYLSDKEPSGVIKDPYVSTEVYINSRSRYELKFNYFIWGVCLPRSCERQSVSKIVAAFYKASHLSHSIREPRIQVDTCQSSTEVRKSLGYYIFMFLVSVAVGSVSIGTLYVNSGKAKEDTIGNIAKALSITSNAAFLTKQSPHDVSVLHGIRALLSCLVVGLHVLFVVIWIGMGNSMDLDRETEEKGIANIYQGESVVDSFLVMSALLLTKSFMVTGRINPLTSILKRYLRFVLFIGPIILYFTFVLVHTGSGPLWLRLTGREVDACSKTWWISLLMLANYIDTTNICYPILWTVPADFQLTVVAILLFWVYQKNTRAGILLYGILAMSSIILPGLHIYQNQTSPVPPLQLGGLLNYRETLFASPIYLWTHLRAGPYFVGLAMGYYISIYKPSDYRNVISYKWSLISLIILYIMTNIIMVSGGLFHDTHRPYKLWQAVVFASLSRPAWAVTFCAFLVVCEYGTLPSLQSFLKWRPFTVLSKLSYGLYLVHTVLYSRVAAALRAPLRRDMFETMVAIYGVISIGFFVSLAIYLFIEAPLSNIINMIFKRHRSNEKTKVEDANASSSNPEKKLA